VDDFFDFGVVEVDGVGGHEGYTLIFD
jgi:hypothetical protein